MAEKNLEDVVNSILDGQVFETEEILDFPSGGEIYAKQDESKPFTVRSMSFEDEKLVIGKINRSKEGEKINVLNFILGRCLSNMDAQKLLMGDWMYALLKLRAVSVGPEYKFILPCPHCGHESETSMNLEDLNEMRPETPIEEVTKYTLPKLKKEIEIRLVRVGDLPSLDFDSLVNNMHKYIVSIAGISTKAVIREVLKKLPRTDMHFILEKMQRPDVGIDRRFIFVCPSCEKESLVNVPIGEDFFTESF